MRTKLLALVAILSGCLGLSQTETFVSDTGGENDPVIYVQPNYQDGPCGINTSSNAFENGKSCTHNLNRIVANDIVVPAGQSLTLDVITVNVFIGATGSGVNALFADLYIYHDNNGEPGGVAGGEFEIYPSSQFVVGTNFGFDVWEIEFDIPDYTINTSGGSDVTFWLGLSIEATDGSNLFWENSTIGVTGYGEAYHNGVSNFVVDATLEGVYDVVAECEPRLDINDHLSRRLRVFPNPVLDGVVTIETALLGEKQVVVYDLLGKAVLRRTLLNSQLDVSSLKEGIYIMEITENNIKAQKKLIIR